MNQGTLLERARVIYESNDAFQILGSHGVEHTHEINRSGVKDVGITIAGFRLSLGGGSYDEDEDETILHICRWHFPAQLPFEACFVKEGLGHKVSKLFGNEPQVGDPIFDDNVYITTSDDDKCLITLTDRCQAAILQFVQQRGEVLISRNELAISFYADEVISTFEMEEQIVLAAHFAQWILD